VWETTVNGRVLHFHLAGINNQNFIMRDEESSSWWQQVTGEAIQGPMKGQKLRPFFHDELTFQLWKQEKPGGRVLRPDESLQRAGNYAPANWEERMARVPVTTSAKIDNALDPRALIIGVTVNGASCAYPFDAILKQSPIVDELGHAPILILLGDDKKSVRVFNRTLDGRKLELLMKPNVSPLRLVDAETGSEWDFSGKAIAGALAGKQLTKIPALNDYWFDWKTYNPNTTIYQLGNR
jgi:Protein of unknown function (DUF3179)